MTFTTPERFILLQILPEKVGSLKETIVVRRLRDEIQFTDKEREALEMKQTEQGGVTLNPSKFDAIDDLALEMTDKMREIVALGFMAREQEGDVPTNDVFVDLYLRFEDDIDALEEEINE